MYKPETWETVAYCEVCDADTQQTFYTDGHERDSSNDWQKCHTCESVKHGLSGKWIEKDNFRY